MLIKILSEEECNIVQEYLKAVTIYGINSLEAYEAYESVRIENSALVRHCDDIRELHRDLPQNYWNTLEDVLPPVANDEK